MTGQQGNPFYVAPMLARGVSDIGGNFLQGMKIGEYQRQRAAQEAQMQRQQAATGAWQAATSPAERYAVMRQFPEMAEEFREQANFESAESQKRHFDTNRGLLNVNSLDDAIRTQQEHIKTLRALGVTDTSNSERTLERMLSGEYDLDDVKNEAKVELMAHPEGAEYLERVERSGELAGSHDLIQLTNARNRIAQQNPKSPMLETYDRAIEARTLKMAATSGGDTAAINNFNKWLELNQEGLSAMPQAEARATMQRAFDEFARPSQIVQLGGGGIALADRITGTTREVVSPEAATQREAAKAGATSAAGAQGQFQGEQIAAAPGDLAKSQQMLGLIDQAIKHPGREAATGASSVLNPAALPGSDRKNYLVLADQLRGQNFLEAYQSLKGGGQITEFEGQKAEQAQARLNMAQSESEYLRALEEMRDLIAERERRIKERLPKSGSSGSGSGRVGRFEMVVED